MLRTMGAHSRVRIGAGLSALNVALQKESLIPCRPRRHHALATRAFGSPLPMQRFGHGLAPVSKKTSLVKCHLTAYRINDRYAQS